jgi:hypothetical protein
VPEAGIEKLHGITNYQKLELERQHNIDFANL